MIFPKRFAEIEIARIRRCADNRTGNAAYGCTGGRIAGDGTYGRASARSQQAAAHRSISW